MERPNPRRGDEPGDIRSRLRAELIEQLPDSPEQPSHIALQLRVAMQRAVLEAHEAGRPIEDEDAHVIAELLSFALDEHDSSLGIYGHRNGLDYDGARIELVELASRPNLRLEMKEVINWLATHLLYQRAPELQPEPSPGGAWEHPIAYKEELGLTAALHIKGTPSRAEASKVFETVTRFVLERGVPALGYLRLPGVDASSPNLDADYRSRYIGSYRDLEAMFDTITEVRDVDQDGKVGAPIPFREQAARDQARIAEGAGRLWCAVDVGGKIHVFHRHR